MVERLSKCVLVYKTTQSNVDKAVTLWLCGWRLDEECHMRRLPRDVAWLIVRQYVCATRDEPWQWGVTLDDKGDVVDQDVANKRA